MLQNSFERGDSSFLFSSRDYRLPADWKTATRQSYRYTHFARVAPKAQMLRLRRCVGKWFSETAEEENVGVRQEKHYHGEHQLSRPYSVAN